MTQTMAQATDTAMATQVTAMEQATATEQATAQGRVSVMVKATLTSTSTAMTQATATAQVIVAHCLCTILRTVLRSVNIRSAARCCARFLHSLVSSSCFRHTYQITSSCHFCLRSRKTFAIQRKGSNFDAQNVLRKKQKSCGLETLSIRVQRLNKTLVF